MIHHAASRLACLPTTHPLSKMVLKAASRYVKKHQLLLHDLMHAYSLRPDSMEKIEPVIYGPKWEPAFLTCTSANKEQAIEEMNGDLSEIQVFIDRLCIDGHVRATVVLYRHGMENQAVRLYLGTQEEHIVFEAELEGAEMGAKLM